MKIVEKWVAGWDRNRQADRDTVIIVKYPFKETPKKFIMVPADTPEWRRAQNATRFKEHFHKDAPTQLFDTAIEALQWLAHQEQKRIKRANNELEQANDRCAKITKVIDQVNIYELT